MAQHLDLFPDAECEQRLRRFLKVVFWLGVVVITAACVMAVYGCGGGGHRRSSSAGAAASAEVTAAWKDVTSCWGVTPEMPTVQVRRDCEDGHGGAQAWFDGTIWVAGKAGKSYVEVCPDLKALRHEFSEYVCRFVPGAKCVNGAGKCWL